MSTDDDLDLDFEDEPKNENLEKALARLKKDNEKLKADLEKKFEEGKQSALKDIETKQNVTSWATKVGNEKLGEVYLKTKPEEITEEGFAAFAADLGFKPSETPEALEETPKPVVDQFHRTGGGVEDATTKRYTGAEANDAFRRGEISSDDWKKLVDEGRLVAPPDPYPIHPG